MEFDISYTDKEITPWIGMVFMRRMLDKTGFKKVIEDNSYLPASYLIKCSCSINNNQRPIVISVMTI